MESGIIRLKGDCVARGTDSLIPKSEFEARGGIFSSDVRILLL